MSERNKVQLAPGRPGAQAAPRAGDSWHKRDNALGALLVAALISLAVVLGLLKLFGGGDQPGPTAVIADELAVTDPNPMFVQAATNLLERAGYAVDYYGGEEVTIDFYRHLPELGHDLILFRTHAARLRGEEDELTDDAGLFTSEPYSRTRYVEEQRANEVRPARYFEGAGDLSVYLGITPDFVKSRMEGTFQDTTVIIMGCDGLRSSTLAEAFVERGAAAVVGWNGPVTAAHTDAATERLLQYLLQGGLALDQAVTQTMADVGPDPTDGTSLAFYLHESFGSSLGEACLAP